MKNKLLIICVCFCLGCKQQKKPNQQNENGQTVATPLVLEDYAQLKKEMLQKQQQYKNEFAKATSATQKKKTNELALHFFERKITKDFTDQWLGTTWDFNGVTQIPRTGDIACGFFVTTVLRDAGYVINRVKYAQCASQIMIQYLCDQADIKTFSNATMETVTNYIHSKGKGLYVTGLDFHTGFIYNDGQEIYFIHSLYIKRVGVVKQKLADAIVFEKSKYKMIGKLSEAKFVERWLK
jgi:hypothetical protein